jgi:hypothetical protein
VEVDVDHDDGSAGEGARNRGGPIDALHLCGTQTSFHL